jgi:hypothetical protein
MGKNREGLKSGQSREVGRGGKEGKAEMSKQTLEAVQVQDAESW